MRNSECQVRNGRDPDYEDDDEEDDFRKSALTLAQWLPKPATI
jgi:hypothetical protein